MPLKYVGLEHTSPDFEHVFPAEDAGVRVIVTATEEVLAERGEDAVKAKAEEKYQQSGRPAMVAVMAADFA